ncbi:hypothetical protein ACFV2X_07230 [Streptomyces sp. NPDC059679]|uniref:hypothetical protein n=1 Tax=Streptomyces sp. NPDC059679 TaxID=3346903 RepID=UPI00368D87EA
MVIRDHFLGLLGGHPEGVAQQLAETHAPGAVAADIGVGAGIGDAVAVLGRLPGTLELGVCP